MKILLAEDEQALSRALVRIMKKHDISADAVFNGEEAFTRLESHYYDAAVLDVMMPKMDGITVLKKIRAEGNRIPILLLTARSEIEDRVLGLDSGANDYLTKPFDTRELLARLRSITRAKGDTDTKLNAGNISLDSATFELSSPTGSFRLANKEYQMMEYLIVNADRILTTDMMMARIWGEGESESNVVWVYISYLRKKLAALQADVEIKSLRNAGYSLQKL